MNTIDYIYRFDPKNPTAKTVPPDAEAAKRTLEVGNRMFSQWRESCRTSTISPGEPQYVVPCNGLEAGMVRVKGTMPKPSPFAVVVGCSDARVPIEMLFGQGFNDLFVIRVAGNLLGDECLGSIDFALTSLSENPRDFNALAIHLAKRLRNAASSAQNDETASPEGGGAE